MCTNSLRRRYSEPATSPAAGAISCRNEMSTPLRPLVENAMVIVASNGAAKVSYSACSTVDVIILVVLPTWRRFS
eukprot:scaffold170717_cov35-Prasinocladus_malaysianus.AAC.1